MLNQSHALQNQGVRAIYGRRESTGDSPRPNLCFKSFDQCYPSYAVLLTGLSRLRHHVSVPTDAPTQQSQDYHWTTASAAGAASVTALWYTAPGCATLQHCTLILRSWHSCSFRASIKDFITGALHQRSLVTLDCFHTDVDLYTQFPCYLSISIHRCDPSIPFSSLELSSTRLLGSLASSHMLLALADLASSLFASSSLSASLVGLRMVNAHA